MFHAYGMAETSAGAIGPRSSLYRSLNMATGVSRDHVRVLQHYCSVQATAPGGNQNGHVEQRELVMQ